MKLGTQVDLDHGHIVLDGDPAPRPQRGTAPNCWPTSIVAKRLDGEDATWYGSRPRPRPNYVRRGPSSPRERGTAALPSFQPMSIVATVAHLSYC